MLFVLILALEMLKQKLEPRQSRAHCLKLPCSVLGDVSCGQGLVSGLILLPFNLQFSGIRPIFFFCSNLIFHHSQDPATNPICPSKPFPPNCLHGTLPDFLSLPNQMWLLNPLYERPSVCIFSVARTLPSPAAGHVWTCLTHLPRQPFLSIINFLR